MSVELNETQKLVLRSLCNTFVPSIKVAEDPLGFWARTASDIGADKVLAKAIFNDVPEKLRKPLVQFLDDLSTREFVKASQEQREKMLAEIASSSPVAEQLVTYYQKQTLLLTYGLPEEPGENPHAVIYGSPQGQNPNWEAMGYPGPISVPHAKPKQIRTVNSAGL